MQRTEQHTHLPQHNTRNKETPNATSQLVKISKLSEAENAQLIIDPVDMSKMYK